MKERHNTYYNSITPESSDAEFLRGVLRKAENMDTINKKRTSKRPVLIACAAALTLCVGVSAAAATPAVTAPATVMACPSASAFNPSSIQSPPRQGRCRRVKSVSCEIHAW